MKNKPCRTLCVPVALLMANMVGVQAASIGKIVFSGSVVEMGCWNETDAMEIHCPRKDSVQRHAIVENIATTLTEPHAKVATEYLDENNQLTLLRIVYD